MMTSAEKTPLSFYELDPNRILSTVEKNGFQPTGEFFQLNSYENRVFDIKLENNQSIIAKYYRPSRWSAETLLDEHKFTSELKSESLQVAEALPIKNHVLQGPSVGDDQGIYYAYFEKVRGRLIQEFTLDHYKKVGRWLAQLHNIGRRSESSYRGYFGPSENDRWPLLDQLISHVTPELAPRYEKAAKEIFFRLDEKLQTLPYIRIHGDMHRGNILESAEGDFVVVDFDDMINGPAIQDFWMLLSSNDYASSPEFKVLVESYSELSEFPEDQLSMIPLLRGYRIINYAIWIMIRWKDPSFPRLFPNFGTYNYWAEEVESLERIVYGR